MPAARKSSLGESRRGPRDYIPYRADDFQHGKKTGIAVRYVDRMSDDFEPFQEVIKQADQRTPFRVQGPRKKRAPKTPVQQRRQPEPEYDDDDGEMSMELEDSTPNSPAAYFANSRVGAITSSVQRVGSSSRPVAHASDVDFDLVPSPRESPSFSVGRSRPNGRASRPSRLSLSMVASQDDVDDDGDDDSDPGGGFVDEYMGDDGGGGMEDMELTPPYQSDRTSRRTSFAQIAQDGDEQDEDGDVTPRQSPVSAKARGKQRANSVPHYEDDEEMEQDIAQGLDAVEQMDVDEDDEPLSNGGLSNRDENVMEVSTKKNKKKQENEGTKKPRGRPRSKKENILRELTPDDANLDGLRRSKRAKFKPLEWWRLEKVVYGRRDNGTCFVPTIKEIRRIPKEEAQPLGAKYRKKGVKRKTNTAEPELQYVHYNPEEGWDSETDPECKILKWTPTGDPVEEEDRRIAFTAKMVTLRPAAGGTFLFQKIFGDGKFMAAGQLVIPVGGSKPTKGTKDNTFVFYLIQGGIKFTVHNTSYILATGAMFMVPRGNTYHLENISDREAKLFFAQARQSAPDGEDESEGESRSRSQSHAKEGRRSSSSGRASSETVRAESALPGKRRTTSKA